MQQDKTAMNKIHTHLSNWFGYCHTLGALQSDPIDRSANNIVHLTYQHYTGNWWRWTTMPGPGNHHKQRSNWCFEIKVVIRMKAKKCRLFKTIMSLEVKVSKNFPSFYFDSIYNHCPINCMGWVSDVRPWTRTTDDKRKPCPPRKVLQSRWKTGSHDLLNNSDEVNRKGGEVVHWVYVYIG